MRIFPVLLLLLVSAGCGRRSAVPAAAVRPVKVAEASGAGFLRKDFAGMATPDDAVTLAFKLSGQLTELPVAQGERVRREIGRAHV